MKLHPRVGATGATTFVVEQKHSIELAGGLPPVLSTPWLIWFLECAAREAVLPWLEQGESSVGLEIEVRHLAPTPLGHTVRCIARVIQVEASRVTFQVEARDEMELIARGVHRRQVVDAARFAKRIQEKLEGR